MKIKTSELIGPALDWAVAKCEGYQPAYTDPNKAASPLFRPRESIVSLKSLHYSHDWSQGGPIIEREGISILNKCLAIPNNDFSANEWAATYGYNSYPRGIEQPGPTPLIAVMRCYVASKLGDEVEIPDGLI